MQLCCTVGPVSSKFYQHNNLHFSNLYINCSSSLLHLSAFVADGGAVPGVTGHNEAKLCFLAATGPSLPCEELANSVDLGERLLNNFYKVTISIVYVLFTSLSLFHFYNFYSVSAP